MDRGAWWAAVHGVAKSRARLSDFTFTFHFHVLTSARNICNRKSGPQSMSIVVSPSSSNAEQRKRVSRGSDDVHTSHLQPTSGTPVDVPVPKNVSFMSYPIVLTSMESSTPNFSFTEATTAVANLMTSFPVAPPRLMTTRA